MKLSFKTKPIETETYVRQNAGDQLATSDGQGEIDDHGPASAGWTKSTLKRSYRVVKTETNFLAGSHILLMILSSAFFPPSLIAFEIDLDPCSFMAYSRRSESKCRIAISRCSVEPCSKTESQKLNEMGGRIKKKWKTYDVECNMSPIDSYRLPRILRCLGWVARRRYHL